ncbi:DUF397 domain-containing protein [Streptomyces sp. CoH17]|uniref:DUF397 domain-containing protein n=1 Tax=Streptomyces sp. CoH17 TaxID=2992806 RepID=UPI00226F9768|nr:DUF397 domain-containing protein [Streptomyces sp. CoH17]
MQDIVRDWYKSSYTTPANNCVETRFHANGSVDVRDTKDRSIPAFNVGSAGWNTFLAAASQGSFGV